jgi:hypothetical protein
MKVVSWEEAEMMETLKYPEEMEKEIDEEIGVQENLTEEEEF